MKNVSGLYTHIRPCHWFCSVQSPSKMPPEITIAETRMNDIITSLKPTIRLLNDIHGAFGTPFVGVISSTTLSLINAIEVGNMVSYQ
jgi:hypothetical protein